MNKCNLNYARVLNLSDYREAKSDDFYTMIARFDKTNLPHSIFDVRRKEDLKELFIKNVPVIYAWGVDRKLKELADKAIAGTKGSKFYGINKTGSDYAFYHPLPRNNENQKDWVKKMVKMIDGR